MTVRDLIAALEACPPDADVWLSPVIYRNPVQSVEIEGEDEDVVVLS